MHRYYTGGGYKPQKRPINSVFLLITLFIISIFMSITLAFLTNSEFASNLIGMSGRVHIEAVGSGTAYNSIEDKDTSNLVIYLQNGYRVLIPGMEINCNANCKVYRSTTKPLLRAKFEVILYDKFGQDIDISTDTSNIIGDLTYQFDNIITTSGNWYQHIDNYYYYIGDNTINAGDTILSEIDATSNNTIVHFIDSPIRFPNYVSSDYSAFGVKVKINFQAIQNFIPDDNGYKMTNTIKNSQKIFSDFANDGLVYTPLIYFDVKVENGQRVLSIKENVTLPETVVLPLTDAEGNLITKLDNSFQGNKQIKNIVVPSTYTEISPNAFANSSVQSVDLSGTQITTLSSNSFYNCASLKLISLPETLVTIDAGALSNTGITKINLPNGLKTIKELGLYITNLTSIYIPESVETIESTALTTHLLRQIVVSPDNNYFKNDDEQMALLSKDGKIFRYFASGNVNIDYHIPDGIEELASGSFHIATINDLYIPASLRKISSALSGNVRIRRFIVDPANPVTFADDNVLLVCNNIAYKYAVNDTREIYTIPDSVLQTAGTNTIRDSYYLKEIRIGKYTDASTTFTLGCSQIQRFVVDSDNPYVKSDDNVSIISKDGKTFYSLVNRYYGGTYIIPEGVTTISNYAIYSTYHIDSYVLPSTLNVIYYCNFNADVIEFKSTRPPTFYGGSISSSCSVIYVPDSAIDDYRNAPYLSGLVSKIKPASQK